MFALRKADQWGIPDVDALLGSLNSRQWSEWMEYDRRYPSRDHQLNAKLMCLLANINRNEKKKPTPFVPADFLEEFPKKPQTAAEMRARLGMMPVEKKK